MRTAVVGRELALGAVKVGARALVRFTVNCTEQVSRCGAALQQLVAILTGLGQLGWECGHSPQPGTPSEGKPGLEQDVVVRVRNDVQRLPGALQLQVLLRRGALPQGNFMYDVMGESQGDGSLAMVLSDAQPGVYYAVRRRP